MFMGSLRNSPAGSRAGEDEDEDDEEALMLGERVGGVPGSWLCSEDIWRPSLSLCFFFFCCCCPPSPHKGSLDGDDEGLLKSTEVELAEAMLASRLARRGVRRTLLLSEDMALKLAVRPRNPLPCLQEIHLIRKHSPKVDTEEKLVSDYTNPANKCSATAAWPLETCRFNSNLKHFYV